MYFFPIPFILFSLQIVGVLHGFFAVLRRTRITAVYVVRRTHRAYTRILLFRSAFECVFFALILYLQDLAPFAPALFCTALVLLCEPLVLALVLFCAALVFALVLFCAALVFADVLLCADLADLFCTFCSFMFFIFSPLFVIEW